jgi:phosphoglycolate phosphatase
MSELQRPQVILFDWDGTLADTSQLILNAYNHVFSHFGMKQWSEEDARQNIRGSAREAFPPIFGDRTDEALKVHLDFVNANHIAHLTALPHARELLEYFREKNVIAGVVSNKRDMILKKEIAHLKWEHLVNVSVGAGVAARDKPSPDSILYALGILNINPSSAIWYVGDTDTDMQAAKAADCSPIFIAHGYCTYDEVVAYDPVLSAHNCHDLLEICQKIF